MSLAHIPVSLSRTAWITTPSSQGAFFSKALFPLFTRKTFVQNSFTVKSFQVVLRQKLTVTGFHNNITEGIKGGVSGDTSKQLRDLSQDL